MDQSSSGFSLPLRCSMRLQQDVVCWTDEKTLKEKLREKTKTGQHSIFRAAAPQSQKSVW